MGILRFRLSETDHRERRTEIGSDSKGLALGMESREKANDRLSHLFISHIIYPYLSASTSLTTTVPRHTARYHTTPHHGHYGNRTVTEIHPSPSRSL